MSRLRFRPSSEIRCEPNVLRPLYPNGTGRDMFFGLIRSRERSVINIVNCRVIEQIHTSAQIIKSTQLSTSTQCIASHQHASLSVTDLITRTRKELGNHCRILFFTRMLFWTWVIIAGTVFSLECFFGEPFFFPGVLFWNWVIVAGTVFSWGALLELGNHCRNRFFHGVLFWNWVIIAGTVFFPGVLFFGIGK